MVTTCTPAPGHFTDLGQCHLDTVISAMWINSVTISQHWKPPEIPFRRAPFHSTQMRPWNLPSDSPVLCRAGSSHSCATLHSWMCFSFSSKPWDQCTSPDKMSVYTELPFCGDLYMNKTTHWKRKNWFDSIAGMVWGHLSSSRCAIHARPLGCWYVAVDAHTHVHGAHSSEASTSVCILLSTDALGSNLKDNSGCTWNVCFCLIQFPQAFWWPSCILTEVCIHHFQQGAFRLSEFQKLG